MYINKLDELIDKTLEDYYFYLIESGTYKLIISKSLITAQSQINESVSAYINMLDMNETAKRGVPKYIYVGPEAPHMIYHQMDASI